MRNIYDIKPIEMIGQKRGILYYIRITIYRIAGTLEILILLLLWILIFSDSSAFGGFSREDMITYIIVGNLIGMITNYLLQRVIHYDIRDEDFTMFLYRPVKYFIRIIFSGFGFGVFPFLVSMVLQVYILYYFINSFVVNLDPAVLSVIAIMVVLAFISEMLIAYAAKLFFPWTIESGRLYTLIVRLKRFFAGNYIPLNLLPPIYLSTGLVLPFAYVFFVPTQLYLGNMDLRAGLTGVGIQAAWIVLFYMIIRVGWKRRFRQ